MTVEPSVTAQWWTARDVAAFLRINVLTVHGYTSRGTMPPPRARDGHTNLWRPNDIILWHANRSHVRGTKRGPLKTPTAA